ncbi:Trypsin Inhibitor-like, cysteine rich domain-containing protein, partial [Strongyloides ratti]
ITCPPNMVFSTCTSACPPKCSIENGKPQPCILMCRPAGCECRAPFALNDQGDCIPQKECPTYKTTTTKPAPISCPKNMVYRECTSGCPPKCSENDEDYKPCFLMCYPPGCECEEPFALNDKGECIPREECPQYNATTTRKPAPISCPKNMVYNNCPSPCQPKCDDIDPGFVICPKKCLKPGCECRDPFLLNDKGECVTIEECPGYVGTPTTSPAPISCPANMVYVTCRSACPPKCSVENGKLQPCIKICRSPGCECQEPFALNDQGECIPREECPTNNTTTTTSPAPISCPANMVYTTCRSACPPRCAIENGVPQPCVYKCLSPGCECRAPFAFNDKGECIPRRECPIIPKCPKNMFYSTCTSSCPPRCSIANGKPQPCVFKCNAPGCECLPPFALNDEGECIPRSKCPVTPTCPGNMVYSTCTSSCPPRCSIENGKPQPCVFKCNAPGCECLPPFALD